MGYCSGYFPHIITTGGFHNPWSKTWWADYSHFAARERSLRCGHRSHPECRFTGSTPVMTGSVEETSSRRW